MFHTWNWGGGMWIGGIFWLLVIGGFVWLILSRSNINRSQNQNTISNESPIDILKKRYAKGEITKEQFDQMKEDLK